VRSPLQSSATAPPGRCERLGAWGPFRGPGGVHHFQSSATAPPGRCERLGAWGPFRGPHLNRQSSVGRHEPWQREPAVVGDAAKIRERFAPAHAPSDAEVGWPSPWPLRGPGDAPADTSADCRRRPPPCCPRERPPPAPRRRRRRSTRACAPRSSERRGFHGRDRHPAHSRGSRDERQRGCPEGSPSPVHGAEVRRHHPPPTLR
jgi:hypothetical protein